MKKLTKSMVCLAAVLVVAASTMGCMESPDPENPLPPISPEDPPTPPVGKASGGGWCDDDGSGKKCTVGVHAQYNDNPGAEKTGKMFTGQFQFKDHGTGGEKFHLNEIILLAFDENEAHFKGFEKDGKCVYVYVYDAGEPGWSKGDEIAIWREPDDPEGEDDPTWRGYIAGGNIQTHP